MFHFCVTAEALPLSDYCYKNSIDATIWSEILQYGLTLCKHGLIYTMRYDAIRCEPSDVSGYLIRTSGCLIWHDLTTLKETVPHGGKWWGRNLRRVIDQLRIGEFWRLLLHVMHNKLN